MRSRYTLVDSEGVYFLTATIVEWIPVFVGTDACQIVLDSLAWCRKNKGLRLYGYVVMENHVHLIAEAPDLSGCMKSFKGYTAKAIVQWAEDTGKTWLVNQLAFFKKRYKDTSDHQVWQEGAHPQLITNEAMFRQKLQYIHDNPVRRGYVDSPEHWRCSSARNYILDDHTVIEIDLMPM